MTSQTVAANPSSSTPASAARPKTRRNAELGLLLLALLVVTGLAVASEAALQRTVTLNALITPAALAVLFGIAHLAVRVLAPYADPVILPCVAAINGIGVIFIRRLELGRLTLNERATTALTGGEGFAQLLWTSLAVAGFVVLLAVIRDHRTLARFAYTAGLVGVVFVLIPAVLPSRFSEINRAKLWIIIPGVGQIQPGEFAKLALMVFFAAYLVAKRDVLSLASRRFLGIDFPRGRDLGPVVTAWLASMLVLVFERDLGTSLMYFGVFVVMLYIATERTSWVIIGLLLFIGGSLTAWTTFSHVQQRVEIWLDPFEDPFGRGYQIVQSLFALGTGGLFGTGPGAGHPTLLSIYASTDFVIAAIGEEIGLFGLSGLLMLYAMITSRGIRAALDVRDSFGKLLAGGLAFSVALQVFVIVGGVSKLIPLTGLTSPFLSYGGSSLLANWLLIAILIRISDAGRRPAPVKLPSLHLKDAPTEVVRR